MLLHRCLQLYNGEQLAEAGPVLLPVTGARYDRSLMVVSVASHWEYRAVCWWQVLGTTVGCDMDSGREYSRDGDTTKNGRASIALRGYERNPPSVCLAYGVIERQSS